MCASRHAGRHYAKYGEPQGTSDHLMADYETTLGGQPLHHSGTSDGHGMGVIRKDVELNPDERKYLMAAERGDVPTVQQCLRQAKVSYNININSVDALGRTALLIAIENDNIELIQLLLHNNVEIRDALLHAINEENVEATLLILRHQQTHSSDDFSSITNAVHKEKAEKITARWKKLTTKRDTTSVDSEGTTTVSSVETVIHPAPPVNTVITSSSFSPDITPLILAAHRDNYEIIKILLDRGDIIVKPHDIRCSCSSCIEKSGEDSLNHSRSRVNAYRALASPSLIALSSKDPVLTAFKLSWELRLLSRLENELKLEYEKLAKQCQDFAVDLLDQVRGSKELEVLLNYECDNPAVSEAGDRMNLARLKLAIKYKQKRVLLTAAVCLMSPVLSFIYIIAPRSSLGQLIRRPFIKFICHSTSYVTFLFLLILASQRIESIVNLGAGVEDTAKKMKREVRGATPTSIEWMILAYVLGLVWAEIKQLWDQGVKSYIHDMWNILDFITNSLYLATYTLKLVAYLRVEEEKRMGQTYLAEAMRENWDALDPTLISEGLFAAANIFSTLKLIYIFTSNPHLGPLQISLGRMINDILKFAFILFLVCFSYSCGVNQLYWYYAEERSRECDVCLANNDETRSECKMQCDRALANLFEILQTLYFAIFGLVDLHNFELKEKHVFTQFIGKLMYGTYLAITTVVLINMLIAMLSNSFQIISNDADTEWKFARSRLWMSYFEEGGTVPAPFNVIVTPKTIWYILRWFRDRLCRCSKRAKNNKWQSIRRAVKKKKDRDDMYQAVMHDLIKRYIMQRQRSANNVGVSEDDINEIKQDISSFRYELLEILRTNGMATSQPASQTLTPAAQPNARQRRRANRMSFKFSSSIDSDISRILPNNAAAENAQPLDASVTHQQHAIAAEGGGEPDDLNRLVPQAGSTSYLGLQRLNEEDGSSFQIKASSLEPIRSVDEAEADTRNRSITSPQNSVQAAEGGSKQDRSMRSPQNSVQAAEGGSKQDRSMRSPQNSVQAAEGGSKQDRSMRSPQNSVQAAVGGSKQDRSMRSPQNSVQAAKGGSKQDRSMRSPQNSVQTAEGGSPQSLTVFSEPTDQLMPSNSSSKTRPTFRKLLNRFRVEHVSEDSPPLCDNELRAPSTASGSFEVDASSTFECVDRLNVTESTSVGTRSGSAENMTCSLRTTGQMEDAERETIVGSRLSVHSTELRQPPAKKVSFQVSGEDTAGKSAEMESDDGQQFLAGSSSKGSNPWITFSAENDRGAKDSVLQGDGESGKGAIEKHKQRKRSWFRQKGGKKAVESPSKLDVV